MSKYKRPLDEQISEETVEEKSQTAQKTKQSVIEVDSLSYSYESYDEEPTDPALDNISFSVYRGEFIAILGHNGSGKSTLAKLLNAQIFPSKGKIKILGMDTCEKDNLWKIRSSCAMVFQNPDNQMVASIVEEDVAFGPENLAIPNPELRRRVDAALKAAGMYEYRRREASHLSGGQKQRVAIAGVLAMLPECIIMDEPTAMLDPSGRKEIIDTIHYLNKEEGKTILLITHNMEEVTGADRILVLNDGKIALQGSPREVFSRVEEMRQLQLDVAQVTELSYLLNKAGLDIPPDCLSIDELSTALLSEAERRGL